MDRSSKSVSRNVITESSTVRWAWVQFIVDRYSEIRNGYAGHRFSDYVEHRRERRGSPWTLGRVCKLGGGLFLIILGIGVGWLPGPGGFVAIIGLLLIAQEVPFVAKALDAVEVVGQSAWKFCRGFFVKE